MALELLIALAFLLLLIVIWLRTIYTENSDLRATRTEFTRFVVLGVLLNIVVNFILERTTSLALLSVIYITLLIFSYHFARITTQRCRDAGWSKSPAYCMLIPFVGLIIVLALVFKGPGQGSPTPAGFGVVSVSTKKDKTPLDSWPKDPPQN